MLKLNRPLYCSFYSGYEKCLKKLDLIKRPDPGSDITIVDALLGFGGLGNPFAADIVDAGWFPQDLFDAAACFPVVPDCGCGIIAFSATFIFTDASGNPTDINGDNRLDTALNEVYYNDVFGGNPADCGGVFNDNPWGINVRVTGCRRRNRRPARERPLSWL